MTAKQDRLTAEDEAVRRRYLAAEPNALGDLHQRMKRVRELAERDIDAMTSDLWHAICDLETEVSYTRPADPPYGRRTTRH